MIRAQAECIDTKAPGYGYKCFGGCPGGYFKSGSGNAWDCFDSSERCPSLDPTKGEAGCKKDPKALHWTPAPTGSPTSSPTPPPTYPVFAGLKLDLRGTDYVSGNTWKARFGPDATLYGNPMFMAAEAALHFKTASMYAMVPLNTDGADMPKVTYTSWMKVPKTIAGGNLGWAISQYPDHGWSRSITLNDGPWNPAPTLHIKHQIIRTFCI